MPDHDDAKKLESMVERILQENDLEAFAEYWDLGRELMEGLLVRAFYVYTEGSYANLGIVTDKLIVDIATDEEDDTVDDLAVIALRAVAEAHFHADPVQAIPDSEQAQLTLVLSMVGATDASPYWIAETNTKREPLARFGKAILNAVNAS